MKADGIDVYCSYSDFANIEDIKPNPKNPNKHPKSQIELLSKIIQRQGWRQSITISNRSGFVVRGHGRLEAAKLLGLKQVPVDRQDYASEESETEDLIADNKIADFSSLDEGVLLDLIKNTKNLDLEMTAFTKDEFSKMMETKVVAEGRIPLSPELFESHSYVVLYFDNELDWQSAKETLGLQMATDKVGMAIPDKNGNAGRKGVGKVIRGADVIRRLNK